MGNRANIVVVGYDPELDYEKLYGGMQALQKGAILIASDLTPTWTGKSGILHPGSAAVVGSFAGMGFYPHAVVGKPSPIAVEMALEHLGLPKSRECLLIGDDLEVDIKAAFNAGIDSLLVFTGVTQLEDLSKSFIKPDYVASSMAQLPVEDQD
ncbi:MAG: HAD hydrolase-like protein [Deltaproteobacteria bacterium]|nr:HAD hydrolase-like protein [Deltaproteobacteria bacterium]